MRATLPFYERRMEADGAIIEMKIWRVPEAVPPSTHELKYSLFYGYPGRRVIGFDNERGKGDHRHIEGEGEQPYTFTTVEALVADFLHAVRAAKGEQT